MRRATTIGLIGLVLLLGAARPASAQWRIIKWLEELSGPGDFVVNQIDVPFGCRGKDQKDESLDWRPFCDQNLFPRTAASESARQTAWKSVRWFFTGTVTFPWFKGTGTNPLDYPLGEEKEHVKVWGLSAGWVYRVSEVTDLGVSTGFLSLAGSTEKSTKKWATDLYTVIRPLATLSPRWEQAIEVRLAAQLFPQGFENDDFGANGETLSGKGEIITQFGISFNVPVIYRATKALITK
jgi:hypothetical protein